MISKLNLLSITNAASLPSYVIPAQQTNDNTNLLSKELTQKQISELNVFWNTLIKSDDDYQKVLFKNFLDDVFKLSVKDFNKFTIFYVKNEKEKQLKIKYLKSLFMYDKLVSSVKNKSLLYQNRYIEGSNHVTLINDMADINKYITALKIQQNAPQPSYGFKYWLKKAAIVGISVGVGVLIGALTDGAGAGVGIEEGATLGEYLFGATETGVSAGEGTATLAVNNAWANTAVAVVSKLKSLVAANYAGEVVAAATAVALSGNIGLVDTTKIVKQLLDERPSNFKNLDEQKFRDKLWKIYEDSYNSRWGAFKEGFKNKMIEIIKNQVDNYIKPVQNFQEYQQKIIEIYEDFIIERGIGYQDIIKEIRNKTYQGTKNLIEAFRKRLNENIAILNTEDNSIPNFVKLLSALSLLDYNIKMVFETNYQYAQDQERQMGYVFAARYYILLALNYINTSNPHAKPLIDKLNEMDKILSHNVWDSSHDAYYY